jgi:hypothetical protein
MVLPTFNFMRWFILFSSRGARSLEYNRPLIAASLSIAIEHVLVKEPTSV